MIVNCPRVQIDRGNTWETQNTVRNSAGFLCELHGGKAEMFRSVAITIGGKLANDRSGDNAEKLCKKS